MDDAVALPDAPRFVGTLIERCADEDVTDPLAVVALVERTSLQLFTLPAESVFTMYTWFVRAELDCPSHCDEATVRSQRYLLEFPGLRCRPIGLLPLQVP